MTETPSPEPDVPNVSWSEVVRFVRQLSHDLRNNLNAAELQSAYLGELAQDPELKEEIKRLRQMMSELGTALQKLTASLGHVKPALMPYPASDFAEDVRRKVVNDFPKGAPTIDWQTNLPTVNLEIDPQLLQQSILELFANAYRHQPSGGPLKATFQIEGNSFVFRLHEPKTKFDLPTENWGREPLRSIGHGHYGLGLNRVRTIAEAHGGSLRAQYDPGSSTLVTTISVPLPSGGS